MASDNVKQQSAAFQPFIGPDKVLPELTFKALILGTVLGIIFGASSVFLALKVGLTVSASIPVAVLSITLFRAFGRSSILENNIVQTTGSAGESIAAGVAFTMPALLILGYDLPMWHISTIALAGGVLGILMMIPLRRALIVKEHGNLVYPEGTACAEVLIVGERGGLQAKTVFTGFGLGVLYKFLNSGLHIWYEFPEYVLSFYRGLTETTRRIAIISAEISPELLGVGYIIGPRIAAIMLAGGALSYLVFIPAIKLFGDGLTSAMYPATTLISQMSPDDVRSRYIFYIGVGAVAAGGIISLMRALPTIANAFKSSLSDLRAIAKGAQNSLLRTERDMPITVVVYGSLALVLAIWLIPQLQISLIGALMVVIFGFFFATVSSRITGEIGSSSNPISGMTVATLLMTCLIFVVLGQTGPEMRAIALSIGAIVCICASNAGTTSQDLKTGFLVGGTPRNMQIGIMVGTITSGVVVGATLLFLNNSYTTIVPVYFPNYTAQQFSGETEKSPNGKALRVHRLSVETEGVPPGKYLADDKGQLLYVIDPGVGGKEPSIYAEASYSGVHLTPSDVVARGKDGNLYKLYRQETEGGPVPAGSYLVNDQGEVKYVQQKAEKMPAPKPQIMALITDGILTGKLPWGLVLLGVFTSIVLELSGVAALPFAVGLYLPFSASAPIFVGGLVRYLVDRRGGAKTEAESETSSGVLFSSGLIAGGSICGLGLAGLTALEYHQKIDLSHYLGILANPEHGIAHLFAITMFTIMAIILFLVGIKGEKETLSK
ncbi:MAG: oligopeptide transporter, OPT family [Acidobacteriota bacterium]